MSQFSYDKTLLGHDTDYPRRYAPELLCPLSRHDGRTALGLDAQALPFQGVDIWTHYEVSWLDALGKPQVAVAEIQVPADSPCLIESKSMKLYFNSLNFERFPTSADFLDTVTADLSATAGAAVRVRLLWPDDQAAHVVRTLPGRCIDAEIIQCDAFVLDASLLRADAGRVVEETLHTHLLRSLCPVTQQPDWGSVMLRYRGPAIDHAQLLAYVVSYRDHPDFHEQCVERMFMDILRRCAPLELTVYARYTRRGGLDINPFRSNVPGATVDALRLFRQ
ncbi:MAG: NADPH-dependent 7-cyano-7-deazaguanine reductase QueF [Moraxellaceae bacterium]|nr:NADPH-dependent 7-cyano-7-deazaguanine reductase QueF [Moraxellaceae bacterium]